MTKTFVSAMNDRRFYCSARVDGDEGVPGRRTIQCHRLIAVLEQPMMTKQRLENSMRRIRQLEQCSIEFYRLVYDSCIYTVATYLTSPILHNAR